MISETVPGSICDDAVVLPARVLIVDADPVTRRTYARLISLCGMRAVAASDGLEAVAHVLEACDARDSFGLIIMNLEMPVVDGWSAATTLWQRRVKSPIIAIGRKEIGNIRRRCLAAGFYQFVSKEGGLDEILLAIQQVIAREKNHRPSQPVAILSADRNCAWRMDV